MSLWAKFWQWLGWGPRDTSSNDPGPDETMDDQ